MRLDLGLDLPERRVGLSAHDFAQAARHARGDPVARGEARRRADRRVALHCSGSRRSRARRTGTRRCARGEKYLDWARDLDHAGEGEGRPSARARGRRSTRGRRSSASPRSSTGCAIRTRSTPSTSCKLAAARRRRYAARRARPRHRDPRRDRRIHRDLRARRCRPTRSPRCSRSARSISRRCRIFPRRARSGGRASCASRTGSSPGRRSGARMRPRCMPKCGRRSTSRSTSASSSCTTRADRIEQLRRRPLRDPRLQDRRAADREAGAHRAVAATARSKARSCAPAASRTCRPGRSAQFAYVALRGREPAGEEKPIEFTDGLTADQHADKALVEAQGRSSRASRTRPSPIARWSARCGRRATATTTIWRASRNGPPAARTRKAWNEHPRRCARRSARRVRSGRIGLGRRQCRLGQDACAGAARDPAAAARHAAGKDPLPHLHQGRRRQHGEPRVRDAGALDAAERRRAGRRRSRRSRAAGRMRGGARMRGGCSRRRSIRRAG